MSGIKTSSEEIVHLVSRIDGQMSEIGKIVGLIGDLATQINLPALNAAIEAARVGDGRDGPGRKDRRRRYHGDWRDPRMFQSDRTGHRKDCIEH